MRSQPQGRRGPEPASPRLDAAISAQLADLHARSTVTKGRGHRSPERREAARQLWTLVNELYLGGVSSDDLGAALGVKRNTVLTQLRSQGFLGGPSPTQRLVATAAGPSQFPDPPSPELASAAADLRQARERLATAKAEESAALAALRKAVLAERAASGASAWKLSVQAEVSVRMVRWWLDEADPAGTG